MFLSSLNLPYPFNLSLMTAISHHRWEVGSFLTYSIFIIILLLPILLFLSLSTEKLKV